MSTVSSLQYTFLVSARGNSQPHRNAETLAPPILKNLRSPQQPHRKSAPRWTTPSLLQTCPPHPLKPSTITDPTQASHPSNATSLSPQPPGSLNCHLSWDLKFLSIWKMTGSLPPLKNQPVVQTLSFTPIALCTRTANSFTKSATTCVGNTAGQL